MKRNVHLFLLSFFMVTIVFFNAFPAFAQETTEDLKKQIESLQKRVDELEAREKPSQEKNNRNYQKTQIWDPFEEMDRLQQEMNRMFQHSYNRMDHWGGGIFSNMMSIDHHLDIQETDKQYEIRFDLTGLDNEKIDIQVNEHTITVKGEHSQKDSEESPNRYFSAQSYGSFMKTIPVPSDADTTKVKTEKKEDMLIIQLPKKVS